MAGHGVVHWNELNTHDPDAAMAFYGRTLGWTFETVPIDADQTYIIIWSGEARVGGIFHMQHPMFAGIPEHWFTHIAVDDIEKRVALVRDNGGVITREPFDVPGVGVMAVLQAASGSYCAFIQPA
ncbi:VOC family protein [Fulvimarina sp. MAC3]|uniref:VOC family protein n=1 Tax=Fulvimarina sp. MAC3 TaxID=3148887 RepID=UPI0031FD0430